MNKSCERLCGIAFVLAVIVFSYATIQALRPTLVRCAEWEIVNPNTPAMAYHCARWIRVKESEIGAFTR